MANTERNCSVLKLANTFERDDSGEELKDRDGNVDRGRYLDRFSTFQSFSFLRHMRTHKQAPVSDISLTPSKL